MPNVTPNFSLNKPKVNDAEDEDLWGGQLNSNVDTYDQRLNPTGSVIAYAGTTAPNSSWLLCDGTAVSRTTYAELFALVSTSFGAGDTTTTFNVPDLRGRAAIGLDNLGGVSADRITDTNADSLNNTGGGDEDFTASGSVGTSGSTALSESQMPSHKHNTVIVNTDLRTFGTGASVAGGNLINTATDLGNLTDSTGGGSGHTHTGGAFSGTPSIATQPWIGLGAIIKT